MVDGADEAWHRRRPPQGVQLGAAVVVAIALVSLMVALESQLGRLASPNRAPHGYTDLHGDQVRAAFLTWRAALEGLAPFHPSSPAQLIRIHVLLALAAAAVLGKAVLLAKQRYHLPAAVWMPAFAVPVALGIEALFDLLLSFTWATQDYPTIYRLLRVVEVAGTAIAVLLLAVLQLQVLGALLKVWRVAPTTARLAAIGATAFFVLLQFADIGAQAEDLLRREVQHPARLVVLALVLGAYAVVVRLASRLQVDAAPVGEEAERRRVRHQLIVGAVLVAYGVGLVALGPGMVGPAVLGVLVLAVAGTSWFALILDPGIPEAEGSGRILYGTAAALPALGLALLTGRLLAAALSTRSWGSAMGLTALEVALLASAAVGAHWCSRPAPTEVPWWRAAEERLVPWAFFAIGGSAILVAIVGLWWSALTPSIGAGLSGIGVLLVGLTVLVSISAAVRFTWRGWDRPPVFGALHFARTPMMALLVVWVLGSTAVASRWEDDARSPHVARTSLEATAGPPACGDLRLFSALAPRRHEAPVAQELCRWIAANATVGSQGDRSAVPLVLVTASGGGVRAATWTARVLDCLLLPPPERGSDPCGDGRVGPTTDTGADPWRYLFAAGGASGGSVGVASTVAERLAPVGATRDWIRALGGQDNVGRLLGTAVLGELVLAPLGLAPGHDRAEVLIDGWAEPFGSVAPELCAPLGGEDIAAVGFLALRSVCPNEVPLMMFNGTVVRTGQRFNISPLDGSAAIEAEVATSWAGGSVDLLDVLCTTGRDADARRQDLSLFDAGFLSARFPFATPSAHFLAGTDEGAGCSRDVASGVDVVDGGYAENSGAGQIGELYGVLSPLLERYKTWQPTSTYRPIEVVLVRIDNGERSGAPPAAPNLESDLAEPLRVPQAELGVLTSGNQSRTAMTSLLAALDRDGAVKLDFPLYPHPGRRLPLGWALTDAIFDDIDEVYRLEPNEEAAQKFATCVGRTTRLACTSTT